MVCMASSAILYLLFSSTLYLSCMCNAQSCGTVKESLGTAGSVLDSFTPGKVLASIIINIAQYPLSRV